MSIKTVVTRGYGNGTFQGTITELVVRGYIIIMSLAQGSFFQRRRRRT